MTIRTPGQNEAIVARLEAEIAKNKAMAFKAAMNGDSSTEYVILVANRDLEAILTGKAVK